MDISSISSAYSALKAIKEISGGLLSAKIDAESKKQLSEVLERLGAVQDTLFYMREELLKLQEANRVQKEHIRKLEEKISIDKKLTWIKPSYWLVEDDKKDGPFCQRCYDVNKNLVRLQGGKNDVWVCHECKTKYFGPNYEPPKVNRGAGRRSVPWL